MSIGLEIDIRDTATPALQRLGKGLAPGMLNPVVGVAARNVVRTHLRLVDQSHANALGGPRTHFYLAAAQGTSWEAVGDGVVVSIASVGIRQRFFGGLIKPRKGKYLTIPAIPEAHGKRASEFDGLRFSFELDPTIGHKRPALVQGEHTLLKRRSVKGVARTFAGATIARRVVFWLVKSVTQKPDPSILPTEADLYAGVKSNVNAYVDRLLGRANGPATPQAN